MFSTKFVFIGLASQHFYCWMLGCYMCNGLEYVPIVPTPHALQLLLCACKITHMPTSLILTTDEVYGMPLKKLCCHSECFTNVCTYLGELLGELFTKWKASSEVSFKNWKASSKSFMRRKLHGVVVLKTFPELHFKYIGNLEFWLGLTELKMCIIDRSCVAKYYTSFDPPHLVYPALTVGHADVAKATNVEISSLDGDVGATRLGTLAGCGQSVIEEGDLVREREEVWYTQHLTIYLFIYISVDR